MFHFVSQYFDGLCIMTFHSWNRYANLVSYFLIRQSVPDFV